MTSSLRAMAGQERELVAEAMTLQSIGSRPDLTWGSWRDPAAVEELTRAHLVTSHEAILAQLLERQVRDDRGPAR
ncbi:MAG TPA: hypothetical protein VFA46_16340 [Actinomycetes bacterium]|nr:hypothetical protein [Actinomycetes bacterium]